MFPPALDPARFSLSMKETHGRHLQLVSASVAPFLGAGWTNTCQGWSSQYLALPQLEAIAMSSMSTSVIGVEFLYTDKHMSCQCKIITLRKPGFTLINASFLFATDLEDSDKNSSTPIARQDDVCDNPASSSSAVGSSRKRKCTKTNAEPLSNPRRYKMWLRQSIQDNLQWLLDKEHPTLCSPNPNWGDFGHDIIIMIDNNNILIANDV
ncbi:hypothetical protein UY3_10217 [Chelonia mydas]|uniref:Uncharacterized protein n=1 Tax=Chelonia mydas TaxID=8469 RepID=M7BAP9_CHEMY|nr:hypothetical protein UY3_10217 [Chelonia mydas]